MLPRLVAVREGVRLVQAVARSALARRGATRQGRLAAPCPLPSLALLVHMAQAGRGAATLVAVAPLLGRVRVERVQHRRLPRLRIAQRPLPRPPARLQLLQLLGPPLVLLPLSPQTLCPQCWEGSASSASSTPVLVPVSAACLPSVSRSRVDVAPTLLHRSCRWRPRARLVLKGACRSAHVEALAAARRQQRPQLQLPRSPDRRARR